MDPSSSTTSPVQPDRSTPERVLDTAATLFWEKGFAATTTREIAAAVGIQQASLYYHVASKEELLFQLCVSAMEQLTADVQAALAGTSDPLERIQSFIRAHLTALLKHQIRHVTVLTELRALSKAHHAEILALRKEYADLVRSLLAEGQAAGKIRRDIPAKYLYLALLNMLNWAVLWFRRDQALAAGELAALFSKIYLNGAAVAPGEVDLALPDFETVRKGSRTRKARLPSASTSERLLGTAASLFSIKGYEATSTREIAEALGVRKASLYYHIGSKEELLFAICKSSLERIRADVEAAVAGVSEPVHRISALVFRHIVSMLGEQEKHSVAVGEMHLLSPQRLAEVRLLRDVYEGLVRSVLQEAQTGGVLRPDIPVKYLCLGLLGLMNRVEIWYRRSGALQPEQIGQLLGVVFLTGAAARPRD